jgi:hypothetical protein
VCRAKLQLPASRNPSPFTASPISYADKVHPHQSIVKEPLCTPLRGRLTTRPKIRFVCGISVTSRSQRFLSYYVLKSTSSRYSSRLFIYLRIDNNRQYTKIQGFQVSSTMRTSSGNSRASNIRRAHEDRTAISAASGSGNHSNRQKGRTA